MSLEIVVIKRDKSTEEFKVCKIKEVIQWACGGLRVNPLELESLVEQLNVNRVTTESIHESIIHSAQTLARPNSPDWVYVAGRLKSMKRWKDTRAYEVDFKTYIQGMKDKGLYTHKALEKYSEEDINLLEQSIIQDRDLQHSYGSVLTAESKYLLDGECIQLLFMVEAMIIFNDRELSKVVELYDALSLRKISLATPWLSNLRSNGNISSCFIISLGDNTESITDSWGKAAAISKSGGGLGIYLGNLRAGGGIVAGRENSAKSITAVSKVFNDIAIYFDQGGKRAGAFTLALPVWHNDIHDFLEIQSEVGDQRTKAHDIFPQVCIHDEFMKQAEINGDWYTFCPHELSLKGVDIKGVYGEAFKESYWRAVELALEGKLLVFTKHKAKDLVKQIMRTQFESGLPYLSFVDTINKHNPNSHIGSIPCTNLCVESYSIVQENIYDHTCNLASIVAGRMESLEEFSSYAALLVEVLNAGIDLTKPPTESSKSHNQAFRTIGIGIQGLHDWLAKTNKSYKDLRAVQEVAEYIQFGSLTQSCLMSMSRTPYPYFKGSKWHSGELLSNYKEYSITNLDWEGLDKDIQEYGVINSQMTSPAPNTSTSCFMDAAAGVMPTYATFFREDNSIGKYPVSSMFIHENPLSYGRSFKTYDQVDLTAAVGALQRYTDTGISAEYLFDQNKEGFSAKDLYDTIFAAWNNQTKAVYYIRSIKKGETVEDLLGIKEEGCAGCAG
jgi:ribonucleoside-diphosphate reductase alpha chain